VDVNCKTCREPWDVHHLTHDAGIIDAPALIGEHAGMGLYESIDTDARIWRWCAPDGLLEVTEGHVLILRCPSCPPGQPTT
jgi:hypothetical protein